MTERWVALERHPGYEVSDLGRVRSVARVVVDKRGRSRRLPGRDLVLHAAPSGYLCLRLDHGRARWVHALVLEGFVGPRPPGMEACHNDGTRDNNRLENLRWDTKSSNGYDRVRDGRNPMSARTNCPRGHPLELPNLVLWKQVNGGTRQCLACARATTRCWKLRRKGVDIALKPVADAYYNEIVRSTR